MAIFSALGCFFTWRTIEGKFRSGGSLWYDFFHFFDNFLSKELARTLADIFVNDVTQVLCVVIVGLVLMPIDLFFIRER